MLPQNNLRKLDAGGFLKDEGSVNGVWNAILQQCYPTGTDVKYLVNPELRIQEDSRPDLLVRSFTYTGNTATAIPVLVFEGKGSDGEDWLRIESQLSTYMGKLPLAESQKCWAIGAKGKEMKLWRYYKANGDFLPWKINTPGGRSPLIQEVERKKAPNAYSVVDDYGDVRILMDFITKYPDPNTAPSSGP
ncbi:hypothetical protein CONPUDRAFT_159570 [Coniophora puteana RWD-64-598 SS2]|uniref:Uncharacterized protein n=1 Tax=Coniophora puteana (strain RWD-64-598) TaxID=741705 RepID=A0A5M3M7P1_CONPW|nr:uncharacterized protein CONPUDRAFT_159570 [Coniophora puteana RWD-64-598 SS2]EIW74790.1 hypothetical protein CONPUDRAFT_159570 [Coniophora puteana RWD-64-598 SS2]